MNVLRQPPELLTLISSPWPFAQWRLDLIGLFYQVGRNRALGVHYQRKIVNFVWKIIVCRFGIPYALITDNGQQFDNIRFNQFCERLCIRQFISLPAHPKSNWQVEVVNKIINGLLRQSLNPWRVIGWRIDQKCYGLIEPRHVDLRAKHRSAKLLAQRQSY